MGRSQRAVQAVAVVFLALGSVVAQDAQTSPTRDFATLHAELCRREKWETVAWKTDFREAHAASVKEGKPIFIWAMDGQTLGCT